MPARMCLRERPRPFGPGVMGREHLGRDHELVARQERLQQPARDDLALSFGVAVGGVEEGDAGLDGRAHDRRRTILVEHPRPPGAAAVAHHAETHARDVESAAAEANLLHHGAFLE